MNEIFKNYRTTSYLKIDVSNLGNLRVTALKTTARFKKGKTYCNDQVWYSNNNRYMKFNLEYIHRMVAELFVPNPENKKIVDHIDTNTFNNRADNLRWVTSKENSNNPLTLKNIKDAQNKPEAIAKRRAKMLGDNNPTRKYGLNDFQKQKFCRHFSGTHYYNNGTEEVRAKECPEGYKPGRLKSKCALFKQECHYNGRKD